MNKDNYQDFVGDEKLEELQEKLLETQAQAQKHKMVNQQNQANLELFEQITTDSAILLAEKQSQLSQMNQKLNDEKAELNRQTELMHQQEILNKSKAYTLQAAQKELEECQLRYCQTIETVNKISRNIQEIEQEVEKIGIQVKAAYNNWQHNYNHLQEQKLATEKNVRVIQQLEAKINNLNHRQEVSKNQAADRLADAVIDGLGQDLDITDFHIADLPKATIGDNNAIPEIPPIDDALAALIKEATSADSDSQYKSLRPNLPNSDEEQEQTTEETADNPEVTAKANDTEYNFWENPDNGQIPFLKDDARTDDEAVSADNNQILLVDNEEPQEQQKTTAKPTAAKEQENKQQAEKEVEKEADNSADKEETPKENQEKKKGHPIISFIICIIIAIAVALLLRMFVFQITEISGDSMYPTLESGERAISSPISYYLHDVERGDIIVFTAPDRTDGVYYVKRVIGLPGEHVVIDNGTVFIDDIMLEEDYLADQTTDGYIDTMVPEGEYFVLGDNRDVSHDSRSSDVSTISQDAILGKLIYQIYPFSDMGKIE